MLNSNGKARAADGLCERARNSGVEHSLQIRDGNTTHATGARWKGIHTTLSGMTREVKKEGQEKRMNGQEAEREKLGGEGRSARGDTILEECAHEKNVGTAEKKTAGD